VYLSSPLSADVDRPASPPPAAGQRRRSSNESDSDADENDSENDATDGVAGVADAPDGLNVQLFNALRCVLCFVLFPSRCFQCLLYCCPGAFLLRN